MIADRILDTLEELGKKLRKWLQEAVFSDTAKTASGKTGASAQSGNHSLEEKLAEAKKVAVQHEQQPSSSYQTQIPQVISPQSPQKNVAQPSLMQPETTLQDAQIQPETIEEKKQTISAMPGKTVYRIKPFKDNEYGTAYWQSFLKSFMDISQTVQYVITGDRTNIVMYAIVPNDLMVYFENVFYASFPTSELIKDTTFVLPAADYWVSYGKDDVLMADKDFMREGAYLDPLKDLYGAFDTIDPSTKLTFVCSYVFKKEKTFWDKLLALFKTVRD